MNVDLTRRGVLIGMGAMAVSGCTIAQEQEPFAVERPTIPAEYVRMYGPVLNEPYPIPAVDLSKIQPQFFRRQVPDPTGERPGTIVVDTPSRYLYLVQEGGTAMRYGIGIGRQGFDWNGDATIRMKREWPVWTPPSEMIAREPDLEQYRDGMPPGLQNPLGARALYLFEGNRDTLYRLHGTQEAYSIGRAVSSGCVRLLNQDIIDLYNRVPVNTRVVVRPLDAPALVA
ncbi:L,D-transpeptidase [Acuticoccus sp. M5D2P5]|uniref:L,D-transpeptidase n=1 Tax=Acuticoccus kalidii TaxID=2910977 RepID=UPI001F3F8FA3|nr:L,D-transpeptidase [Acuticoccus kalidii]MCF3936192.1 L,D-transpeptidase [Acuticoccus kalidii]